MPTRQLAQIILEPVDRAEATLPKGAKFLGVECPPPSRLPHLFVEVDPAQKHENVRITILAQGSTIPPDAGDYVGTFSMLKQNTGAPRPVFEFYHVYTRWTGVEVALLKPLDS